MKMIDFIKSYMRQPTHMEMANRELEKSKSFKYLYKQEGESKMKWNIFERLNTLEKELHELREVVRYQMDIIISLQLANIEQEGAKLVESETERRKRNQREWYVKNKDAILDRRNAAKKLKNAQENGDSKKAYYWRNREKMREYGRQYYKKKKLAAQRNK
jgi:hypothetical protein